MRPKIGHTWCFAFVSPAGTFSDMAELVDHEELAKQISSQLQLVEVLTMELAAARNRLESLYSLRSSALALDGEAEGGRSGATTGIVNSLLIFGDAAQRNAETHRTDSIVHKSDGSIVIGGPKQVPSWRHVRAGTTGKYTVTRDGDGAPATPVRTNIPSTQMVADIVIENGGAWTRDELIAQFAARYGFPDSWTNPNKALNNAIARAVDRGLIREMTFGVYAPPDPDAPKPVLDGMEDDDGDN